MMRLTLSFLLLPWRSSLSQQIDASHRRRLNKNRVMSAAPSTPTTDAPSLSPSQHPPPSLVVYTQAPDPTISPTLSNTFIALENVSVPLASFDLLLSKPMDNLGGLLESYLYNHMYQAYDNTLSVALETTSDTAADGQTTYHVYGSVAFAPLAPNPSDVQALQTFLLTTDQLNKELGQSVVVTAAVDEGSNTNNKSNSTAVIGGSVAGAAVLLVAIAGIVLKSTRKHSSISKSPHLALEDDEDDSQESSVPSKRSQEMPSYDLEVQETGSQLVIISSTPSPECQDPKQHRFQLQKPSPIGMVLKGMYNKEAPSPIKMTASLDESYLLDDDNYSLRSGNGLETIFPTLVLLTSSDSKTKNPSKIPTPTSTPTRPTAYLVPSRGSDDDSNSDADSLFTTGPSFLETGSISLEHAKLKIVGIGGDSTVLHANTSRPVMSQQLQHLHDDLDELMGPMPELRKLRTEQEQLDESMEVSNCSTSPFDEASSQPSDEAMDNRDLDLSGFEREIQAARNRSSGSSSGAAAKQQKQKQQKHALSNKKSSRNKRSVNL